MHRLVVTIFLSLPPTPPPATANLAPIVEPSPTPSLVAQPAASFEQRFTSELERLRRVDRASAPNDYAPTRETLRAALIDAEPLADPILDLLDAAIQAHALALESLAAELGADDVDALPALRRLDPRRGGTGSIRVEGIGPLNELVAHHRAWLDAPDGRHQATVAVFSLSGAETPRIGRLVIPITRWIERRPTVAGSADGSSRRVLYPEHWLARSELFWLEKGSWERDEPVWLAAREPAAPRRPAFGRGGLACDVDCAAGVDDLNVPSLTTETGLRALPFRPTVEGIPSGARERARRGPRRQP